VHSSTTFVLDNGSLIGEFKLGRGLHQRNPLTPFLLLIAVEGLNVMFNASVMASLFTGYGVGDNFNVQVSPLQIVEDTLLLLGVKS